MVFKKLLIDNDFSLVVSLPANRIDLVQAAIDGGADAIKVHLNVQHAASGNLFGSFEDNKEFLKSLVKLAGHRPVGLVPGAADAYISSDEVSKLEDIGVDFFSSYSEHLPVFMLKSQKLTKMVAIHDTYQTILEAIRTSEIDIVEASIMPTTEYRNPLNYFDVLQYRKICEITGKPVLIPTQKAVLPGEVFALKNAGCKAVMIGANVMKDQSAESCLEATIQFRKAIDNLK